MNHHAGSEGTTPGGSHPYSIRELEQALPRFSQFRFLGAGGFGAVFSAWDSTRKVFVALKLARDNGDPSWQQRFLQEFKILERLHSQHLVRVFDTGRVAVPLGGMALDHLWFTMEKCGLSVADELPSLALDERVRICLEMLSALAELHVHDVVHRDLKPRNLFLTPKRHLKLGDFGIAKDLSGKSGGPTPTGYAMGTMEYMAPERWKGQPQKPERADIEWRPSDQYAAGVTAFHLLSGGGYPLDFTGERPMAVLNAHLMGKLLELTIPELPGARCDELNRVFRRMLAKEPERRYPDMARCRADFEVALKHQPLRRR